jgi:hypothetical protein
VIEINVFAKLGCSPQTLAVKQLKEENKWLIQ